MWSPNDITFRYSFYFRTPAKLTERKEIETRKVERKLLAGRKDLHCVVEMGTTGYVGILGYLYLHGRQIEFMLISCFNIVAEKQHSHTESNIIYMQMQWTLCAKLKVLRFVVAILKDGFAVFI